MSQLAPPAPVRHAEDEAFDEPTGLAAAVRKPAVLGLAAVTALLLGTGGFLLLGAGDGAGDELGGGPFAAAPRAVLPSASPTGSSTTSATGSANAARNPFRGLFAGSPAGPVTRPPGVPTGPAVPVVPVAPAGPVATSAPTTVPTVTVAQPAVVRPAVTVTRVVSSTVTAAPKPSPIYLGLYGFTSAGKAQFRVNERSWTVAASEVFAVRFKFVAKVGTPAVCAKVLYGDATVALCQGDVVKLG